MTNGRATLKEKMRRAQLLEKIPVQGDEVAIFRVEPLEGEVFPFVAGQYATLGLDVGEAFVARAYSIASSQYQREHLEFYINVIEQGQLTPSLFALKPGDEVFFMGPKGIFTLKRTQASHLFFIATGTGLAPFVSMLRTMHDEEKQGVPQTRTITLVHGVRYSADLGYRDELDLLARGHDLNIMYLPMVSRPDQDPDWTPALGRGRVTELLKGLGEGLDHNVLPDYIDPRDVLARLPAAATAVYLCGNPDMITDSKRVLSDKGFGEIHTEEYW